MAERTGRGRTPPPDGGHATSGALGELIALERRLEEALDEAHEEARRTLEAAEREARELAERFDDELARAVAVLRERLEGDCDARIRQLRSDADAEIARYRAVDAKTVRALGAWAARRVVGDEGPP